MITSDLPGVGLNSGLGRLVIDMPGTLPLEALIAHARALSTPENPIEWQLSGWKMDSANAGLEVIARSASRMFLP